MPSVMKHVAADIVRGHDQQSDETASDCSSGSSFSSRSAASAADAQPTSDDLLKHRVFVYGTLKQNQPNHCHFNPWKVSGKCRFIGRARSSVPFPLIVATRWNLPFLLCEAGKGKVIEGEVYDVDDSLLAWMDTFEGHPEIYQRDRIVVDLVGQSSTSTNSATSRTLPDDHSTVPDERDLADSSGNDEQKSGVNDHMSSCQNSQSTTCWAYFMKNYIPVLLQKESYANFDAFSALGKSRCPNKDLEGSNDIEHGLNNETASDNNNSAVGSDKPDGYAGDKIYKDITGIQEIADELAREVACM